MEEQRRQIWVRCMTCERQAKSYAAWIDDDQLRQGEWDPVMDGRQIRVRSYTWDTDRAKVIGGYRFAFEDATDAGAGVEAGEGRA